MSYKVEFASGHTDLVAIKGRCPQFLIGLAHDERGYARVLFIADDGRVSPQHFDPWVARVVPAATPAKGAQAYQLVDRYPADAPLSVVTA